MAPDPLPYIGFGYDDDNILCAVVGSAEYRSLEQLLAGAPYLRDAGNEVHWAGALSHFQSGMTYGVIKDIQAYRDSFLRRYAAEEELPWDQFQLRVGDFDLPDLDQLSPPQIREGRIVFFVNHRGLDAPYRVEGPVDGSGPLTYEPL